MLIYTGSVCACFLAYTDNFTLAASVLVAPSHILLKSRTSAVVDGDGRTDLLETKSGVRAGMQYAKVSISIGG